MFSVFILFLCLKLNIKKKSYVELSYKMLQTKFAFFSVKQEMSRFIEARKL